MASTELKDLVAVSMMLARVSCCKMHGIVDCMTSMQHSAHSSPC